MASAPYPQKSSEQAPAGPIRCVSIDVEDYFHIEAAQGTVKVEEWDNWPSRVQRNVELLLALLDRHNRKGTFFFLGWVARKHPQLARQVAAAGHEIASHGSMHQRLHRLDATTFREDLLACKRILEDQTGQGVLGYRAPTFSLVPQTAWAIDVLLESGFQYDSSIFPVLHPLYGVPAAPDRPFMVKSRPDGPAILEIPPLTWSCLGRKWAVAGGGYFRLLPLWFMRRGLRQSASQDRPAVLYFHPWEFDPDQPRMPLPLTGRIRTYTGLKSAAGNLERIVALPARWARLCDVVEELRADSCERIFALTSAV